jgi:hypothetical protein
MFHDTKCKPSSSTGAQVHVQNDRVTPNEGSLSNSERSYWKPDSVLLIQYISAWLAERQGSYEFLYQGLRKQWLQSYRSRRQNHRVSALLAPSTRSRLRTWSYCWNTLALQITDRTVLVLCIRRYSNTLRVLWTILWGREIPISECSASVLVCTAS